MGNNNIWGTYLTMVINHLWRWSSKHYPTVNLACMNTTSITSMAQRIGHQLQKNTAETIWGCMKLILQYYVCINIYIYMCIYVYIYIVYKCIYIYLQDGTTFQSWWNVHPFAKHPENSTPNLLHLAARQQTCPKPSSCLGNMDSDPHDGYKWWFNYTPRNLT